MTPKVILFPTDFSARCDRPRDRAVRLAQLWGATLVLLHVNETPDHGLAENRQPDEARLTARLRAEVDDPAIEVETRLANKDVADAIIQTASDVAADLIVTGLSRRDELGDLVIGTTVERVVRHTSSLVLVVKDRPQADYTQLMVATDFSDCSALALETATTIFPTAAVSLVHAYQVRFEGLRGREGPAAARQVEIVDELEVFLQRAEIPTGARGRIQVNVDYGDVCTVARHHVQSSSTDLAVVGTHGRSGVVAAVLGSTARALLTCLECDVLLVRQTRKAAPHHSQKEQS